MEVNFGYVKSITIGVNLDENLRPKESGILSVNKTSFQQGTVMDLDGIQKLRESR